MRMIHRASLALLCGAALHCAAYAQSPGDRTRPDSPNQYGQDPYDRDRDGQDRRDPARGYEDRGYPDRDGRGRGYYDSTPRDEVGFFYDELSPYGDWILSRDYGWAWFPRDVHSYWRPYSDGRWVNTEYGWTWASNEPFGWATYHYGRWAWDQRFGWLWIPGTTWGPAWVSWQYGGGYVGWAPLPPSVGFEANVGLRIGGLDLSFGIQPDVYSFVPERSFLEIRLSTFLIPSARNVTLIRRTRNVTDYSYIDHRVVNRGVTLRNIEQATGRRVRQLRVGDSRSRTRTEVGGTELRIYRPGRQQLDSVRVEPRNDAGRRPEAPPADRDRDRNAPGRRDAPEFEVAPRVNRTPRPDDRQLQSQERRGQQELEQYQAEQTRKIEKLHQQEMANVRVTTERDQVEKQHQAELKALEQEQRDAAQQLDARQKARRQAEVQPPPEPANPPAGDKPGDRQREKKEKKDKQGRGRPQDDKPYGEDEPGGPPPV